jgi:hypothetical protein
MECLSAASICAACSVLARLASMQQCLMFLKSNAIGEGRGLVFLGRDSAHSDSQSQDFF